MMNLFMGFFAIIRIGEGGFEESVWLIALALICDSLDGNVARIFKTSSELGKELDSLGDMVSFVAAPALLILKSWPYQMAPWMIAIVFFYLGAGAYRLARYNINTSPTIKGYFRGLPTPATAIIVVTTCMGFEKSGLANHFSITLLYFSWLGILSFLMVSHLPYPKITMVGFNEWKGLFFFAAALFIVAYKSLSPEFAVAVPFILFALSGIFSSLPVIPQSESPLEAAKKIS